MLNIIKELKKSGRFEEIIEILKGIIIDGINNNSVIVINNNEIIYNELGIEALDILALLTEILEDEIILYADVYNLTKFVSEETNKKLHNYAVSISHRNEVNELCMEKIRTWLVLEYLLNFIDSLDEDDGCKFRIPEGWKKLSD